MEQELQTLSEFCRNRLWSNSDEFVADHPHHFLVIEIRGDSPDDSTNQTARFQTLTLQAPGPDGAPPATKVATRFVAPLKKHGNQSNPFSMITLGRTTNNDIVIKEVHISKMHCFFKKNEAGEIELTDPGSTNGTYIDDVKLAEKKPILLQDGVEITIGKKVHATFHQAESFYAVAWPK